MLSSNEERGTGTSTANWKIKNRNKTNPNHYPFSVFVPFFFFFNLSVPGRRSFPFSVIPRNITPPGTEVIYLQAKPTKAATGAKLCRSSCD